jgi:hypothetical protein
VKIRLHLALMVTTLLVPVVLSSALALDALLDGEREAVLRSMRPGSGMRCPLRLFLRKATSPVSTSAHALPTATAACRQP